jgi:hypothetical protein
MIYDAPDWFSEAVGTPAEPHWVQVDGCAIHYRWPPTTAWRPWTCPAWARAAGASST